MSKLQKIILILVGAVVALIGVVIVGRNLIIKTSVPPAVRAITGFDASVSDVDVALFSSMIAIKDLKVSNPDDFADKRMLNAPAIYVEYKLGSIMSDPREFPVMRLNIQEVVVVKNAKGESNVARIMAAKPKRSGPSAVNHFGSLELTLGKVTYLDYSRMIGDKPWTQEMTLNFHQTFSNISDEELKKIIMLQALRSIPVKLADITADSLEKDLKNVTGVGIGLATNVTGMAAETIKGLGGLLQSKTNAPTKGR